MFELSREVVITGLEGAALKVGASVATHGATWWMRRRTKRTEQRSTLIELVEAELASPLQRVKVTSLVERIGHQVAEHLAPALAQRFAALPANEVEAALLAVVDTLDDVDLSDETLFAANVDADELARHVRAQFPDRARAAGLSSAAHPVYELALDQACRYLVQVVRHLPSFKPAALAEILGRLTNVADQLSTVLNRVPTTSLFAPEGTDHDADFATRYLHCLVGTLDHLELLGLPGDEQPKLALTVAYLSLSVSGESSRGRNRRLRPELWFDQLGAPEQADGVPVESAIGPLSRVLLRGDAGSGKTTLLNWLGVRAARRELGGALAEWNGCVPFLIRLRGHVTGDLPSPEQFVRESAPSVAGLMPAGWVHRQLVSGVAAVLVDGVDEVPPRRRREVKSWLRDLLATFPRIRVVITARTAAADRRWLAELDFTAVTLEPMGPASLSAFVDRWHRAAEAAGATVEAAERRLRGQLERPHLRELAASPLLCAMLCALNLAQRSELPRNRMDLYSKALAMLLHLRDAERGIEGLLTDTEKRVLLRDLAWRLTLANRIELAAEQVVEHLANKLPGMPNAEADPEVLLAHLVERSGVLRAPVPGKVDFVHRTFQEYLAADEAIQQHHMTTLIGQAHLDTWWETVVMACGHATAKQADEILNGVLDRSAAETKHARHLRLLAAACLETVQDITPATRSRVDTMVQEKLVPPRSVRETRSLAAVGHRILGFLPKTLTDLSDAQAAASVRAAALTCTKDAIPLLASYAQDTRQAVQREIEAAWSYFDPRHFADVVLADSPLHDGEITVRHTRLLPHLHGLRHLTALRLELFHTETLRDLAPLTDLPALTDLQAHVEKADLRYLARYHNLRNLRLYGDRILTGRSFSPSFSHIRNLVLTGRLEASDWIRALPTLQHLNVRRMSSAKLLDLASDLPDLQGLTIHNIEDSQFVGREPLGGITILAAFGFDEFRPDRLSAVFPGVQHLNLSGLADVDLTPLRRLSLQSILLQNFIKLDFSPLTKLATLEKIQLFSTPADLDLSALSAWHGTLTLDRNAVYRNLDGIKSKVKVRYW